jgi:glycosyltransferase involved in cell wall biosynthesis
MSNVERLPLSRQLVRLVVVMPALDEEATVGAVIAAVPRAFPGVEDVQVVVVDDGSSDRTRIVALTAGADEVLSHPRRRGLVASFNDGMREALRRGADIVVHLDSDGQHDPAQIPDMVRPILHGQADIVVGVRSFTDPTVMAPIRRHGNRVGSWVFRRLLGLPVSDFTSGYRAYSRESLLQLNIVSDTTHTLETLIQAARKQLTVAQVAVPVRPRVSGESRMTASVWSYIRRTAGQAFRCLLHQDPLALFGPAAGVFLAVAVALTGWFVWAYNTQPGLHLPALLGAVLAAILAIGLFIAGLLADGVRTNQRLVEEALYHLKRQEHPAFDRLGLDAEHDQLSGQPRAA